MSNIAQHPSSNQTGAIGTFAIIAIGLLIAVGGVITIAKLRSDDVANQPIISQNDSEDEDATEETQTEEETSETPAPSEEETSPQSNEEEEPTTTPSTGPSDVPATGPVEMISGVTAVSVLGYAGIRYANSRRQFFQKSLRR